MFRSINPARVSPGRNTLPAPIDPAELGIPAAHEALTDRAAANRDTVELRTPYPGCRVRRVPFGDRFGRLLRPWRFYVKRFAVLILLLASLALPVWAADVDKARSPVELGDVLGTTTVSGAAFTITAAFSGAWFDATQNGHGFLFQVLPGGLILVYWFTYDSEGNPVWFFGVGTIDGNQVEFDLLWEPSGPNFPPDYDPEEFNPIPWGTLIIVFFDCDTGMAEWVSKFEEFGAGEMDLERITSTDTLDCEI
jgi:hypothetical protein